MSALRGGIAPRTVHGLCGALGAAGLKATLVLDGRAKPDEPSAMEFPGVDIVYSGTGVPADAVIGQMVERSRSRKKLTVVTDDRAVALQARRLFANALSCDGFLELLFSGRGGRGAGLPARKVSGLPTSGETAHWLKEFGMTAPLPEAPRPAGGEDDLDIEKLLGPRDP